MQPEPIQSLFRQEFSRIVAVISHLYGLQHIEVAEDIVSETFLAAAEQWPDKGVPPNPTAWLYVVAKQKALYHLRRNKLFNEKIGPGIKAAGATSTNEELVDFSEQNIKDSQLRMMFAVCHPAIANESQIGLTLRILCGFTIEEIAEAFLTNKETINKRLYRAKEKLREIKIRPEDPTVGVAKSTIDNRLQNVLHVIYLLFNEGYYSWTHKHVIRENLCGEAIRLAMLLTEFTETSQSKTHALIALMLYHASRFKARRTEQTNLVMYADQDQSLWDQSLIDRANHHLGLAATGNELSSYHLEAGIAFWHCRKDDISQKWESILQHYDLLLQLNPSPIVSLNRAYAVYKVLGRDEAIKALDKLPLFNNHFYFTLLAELYAGVDNAKAVQHLQTAITLARTATDKALLSDRLNSVNAAI